MTDHLETEDSPGCESVGIPVLPPVALFGAFVSLLVVALISARGWSPVGLSGVGLLLLAVLPPYIAARRRGATLDPFHPLVFFAWSFVLPGFVLAGFLFDAGFRTAVFGTILKLDPVQTRLQAIAIVGVGSISLTCGFFLPGLRRLASSIPRLRRIEPTRWTSGLVAILIVGTLVSLTLAFRSGTFGYQVRPFALPFASVFAYVGVLIYGVAAVVGFLRERGWWLAPVLAGSTLLMMFYTGSRGFPFRIAVAAAGGYFYRKLASRRALAAAAATLVVAVMLGMTLGTMIRDARLEEFGRHRQEGISTAIDRGPVGNVLQELAARLAGLGDLSVVVGFSETYKERELEMGIRDTLRDDLVSGLVPRFLMPDKPTIGSHDDFVELYFGVRQHQPAVTYMGDLYRAAGLPAVVLGMFLFGCLMRLLYVWLVDRPDRSPGEVFAWMAILVTINFEHYFGPVLPEMTRRVIVIVAVMCALRLIQTVWDRLRGRPHSAA